MKRHVEFGWCGVGDRTKPEEEDEERETNSNGGVAFTPPTPSGGNATWFYFTTQLTTLISKSIVKVFTLDEYFYQPCIYKFLCLKSTHARG
jgi:hypothetical protein